MIRYYWKDEESGEIIHLDATVDTRNVPPSLPGTWTRVLTAPTVLRASYLDGQRKDLNEYLITDKLKRTARDLPKFSEEHRAVTKEIKERASK